ncbi:R-spondin-2 Cysteine-rich and single thrombospondin domain-containing protein 2 [Triplophysa tibetana]|uniref:R-spondin-2 n=1 Tax=Triplophysa tibetana TaxID=1572043 RepID=A0A5A9N3N6_9TELE|nr:R-spondin-2 Cysteine-rich and single thrombospondin domain-containing protein 2 [Triplophysa tibetana]
MEVECVLSCRWVWVEGVWTFKELGEEGDPPWLCLPVEAEALVRFAEIVSSSAKDYEYRREGYQPITKDLDYNQSLLCLAASYGTYPICKGCSVCSKDNGCMNCQPKLFLFLRRERMRQYGECLHSCPSGFYGMRGTEINMCSRCRIDNCEACFSKDFCTKCKPEFYLHKGRCFDKCPEGFAPLEDSMECGEGCEVGQWTEWGSCNRRNKTCGFKWGLETRTRHIVKKPPKDTIPCPTIAESRRCKMAMRHCRRAFMSVSLHVASLNLMHM